MRFALEMAIASTSFVATIENGMGWSAKRIISDPAHSNLFRIPSWKLFVVSEKKPLLFSSVALASLTTGSSSS